MCWNTSASMFFSDREVYSELVMITVVSFVRRLTFKKSIQTPLANDPVDNQVG